MGYRNYIGSLPRVVYDNIKGKTIDELWLMTQKSYNDENGHDIDITQWDDEYEKRYEMSYHIERYLIKPHKKELYNFGKYVNFSNFPENSKTNFFDNEELNSYFDNDDTEYVVVNNEFFKYVINEYKGKIQENYKNLFLERPELETLFSKFEVEYYYNDGPKDYHLLKEGQTFTVDEVNCLYECLSYLFSNSREWNNNFKIEPFKLDDEKDVICTSNLYEYSIFELVRIYKSFDWENNIMIYYGH